MLCKFCSKWSSKRCSVHEGIKPFQGKQRSKSPKKKECGVYRLNSRFKHDGNTINV